MPSILPVGEPSPPSGELPLAALAEMANRPLSLYLHVPFCATRCGYCDFNTYTAQELGGMSTTTFIDAALAEIRLAHRILGDASVATIFFGGGTPSLLAAGQVAALLEQVGDVFSIAPDAEITLEANPESVDDEKLTSWLNAGVNRLSIGMQSAVAHVLATLDRVHTPGRPAQVIERARELGFRNVSLDVIYGAPGESDADWQATLAEALAIAPDHVSAYSLIVEPGTRLARRIERGELDMPDEDALAAKYLMADDMLMSAGFANYETSNWTRDKPSRHNLAYWTGENWWGIGPGAHSHVGGVRWWNVKHPRAYADRLAQGESPAHAREVLDAETRRVERIMLELRLAQGIELDVFTPSERARVEAVVEEGLAVCDDRRLRLTRAGRLLADGIVVRLLG